MRAAEGVEKLGEESLALLKRPRAWPPIATCHTYFSSRGVLRGADALPSARRCSMRYAVGLLVVSLSLTAVAQTSPSSSPAPAEQTPRQPKDVEVDKNKPAQGNVWSEQAKSPSPSGSGTHKQKAKSDGGHP